MFLIENNLYLCHQDIRFFQVTVLLLCVYFQHLQTHEIETFTGKYYTANGSWLLAGYYYFANNNIPTNYLCIKHEMQVI